MKQDREVDRIIEKKNQTFGPAQKIIFAAASQRFLCCKIDNSEAITKELIDYIKTLEQLIYLDFKLVEKIIKEIIVKNNGSVEITYLNEKRIVEHKETEHNADDSQSTENSYQNTGKSDFNIKKQFEQTAKCSCILQSKH